MFEQNAETPDEELKTKREVFDAIFEVANIYDPLIIQYRSDAAMSNVNNRSLFSDHRIAWRSVWALRQGCGSARHRPLFDRPARATACRLPVRARPVYPPDSAGTAVPAAQATALRAIVTAIVDNLARRTDRWKLDCFFAEVVGNFSGVPWWTRWLAL